MVSKNMFTQIMELKRMGKSRRYISRKLGMDKKTVSKYYAMSDEGYLQYAVRSYVVEPAFGNIKQNRGFRQFYYRGLEKVITEWKLMCAGVNFSKIIAFLQGKDWKNLLQEAFSG